MLMLGLAIPVLTITLILAVLFRRGMLFSPPPRNIDDMIPYVTSMDGHIDEFERFLHATDWNQANASRRAQTLAYDEALKRILELLGGFSHNSSLFGAVARHELHMIGRPELFEDYGHTVEALFQRSWICQQLVLRAKVHAYVRLYTNKVLWIILPMRPSSSLVRHCRKVLQEYGEVRGLALCLASRHGEHYYENLLSAL